MNGRDLHSALKSEVVKTINAGHLQVVLVQLQWGKNDVGYSLHVNPSSFTTYGIQATDFLGYLGFQRSERCSFTGSQQCYCRWVSDGFSVEEFAAAFNGGYSHLGKAEKALEACGFLLPQPEGWGFHFGCVGPRRAPELRMLQTAMNQITFSSRSLDLRFLGSYPKPITKDDISVAHAGGKPAEATVLLVGYGADPINAFHVGRRAVLNNGFHRVFALRSEGVTKIPIVLQEVANADIEFPDSLLGLSRAYLLQSGRPVVIKDFFDDGLVTEVRLKPRRKVVKVSWGVEDSVVPE